MLFTPSVLAENADDYLENTKECVSPSMSIGFASKEEQRQEIIAGLPPGDFSARPQFVQKVKNSEFWSLIDEFRKIKGIPGVMNTSLNMRGDRTNYDLADATRTLAKSRFSFLVMPGDKLLSKISDLKFLKEILGR